MSFKKCLVLFLSLAAGANALATPHVVRHSHHHRAIAARVAAPAPLDVPVLPLRKRQNTQKCKQRSSSVQGPTSSSASSSSVVVKATSTTPAAPPPSPTTKKETTTHAPATTQAQPTPTPTPTPAAAASSSDSGSNEPSFMVGTQTGQGTFYATGLGACGITNTDADFIAAASHLLFDNFPGYNDVNPNDNPICNRKVTATYQGKSVTVAITDRCAACAVTDLDFSPAAFDTLADPSVGRISGMTWVWD